MEDTKLTVEELTTQLEAVKKEHEELKVQYNKIVIAFSKAVNMIANNYATQLTQTLLAEAEKEMNK